MPKKILSLFLVLSSLFFVFFQPAFAQAPSPTGQPTCDLCGWCVPNPQPQNWTQCRSCLYNTNGTPKPRTYFTVFGCLSTEPAAFVKSLLGIIFAVSGGIAFLAFLGGSAIVLTSAGDPEKLQSGKDTITSAVFGILLILFSVFLLRVVGYDILQIPGFG